MSGSLLTLVSLYFKHIYYWSSGSLTPNADPFYPGFAIIHSTGGSLTFLPSFPLGKLPAVSGPHGVSGGFQDWMQLSLVIIWCCQRLWSSGMKDAVWKRIVITFLLKYGSKAGYTVKVRNVNYCYNIITKQMPGWLNPMRNPIIISQWEMYILQRYLARRQIWFWNLNEQLSGIKKITFNAKKNISVLTTLLHKNKKLPLFFLLQRKEATLLLFLSPPSRRYIYGFLGCRKD